MTGFLFFGPLDYWFWHIVLGAPVMVFAIWAQWKVQSTFAKYERIRSRSGIRGCDAAWAVLRGADVQGVGVEATHGRLSDHYDPRAKVLRLSEPVYGSSSLAALGVAAHEAGHAIQDKVGYAPLRFRSAWVPLAGIGSNLGILLFFIGLAISPTFALAGIVLFGFVVLFTLVTVPVEFDASRRAVLALRNSGIISGPDEERAVRAVLLAAGLTYVAAAAQALAQLLALVLTYLGRQND